MSPGTEEKQEPDVVNVAMIGLERINELEEAGELPDVIQFGPYVISRHSEHRDMVRKINGGNDDFPEWLLFINMPNGEIGFWHHAYEDLEKALLQIAAFCRQSGFAVACIQKAQLAQQLDNLTAVAMGALKIKRPAGSGILAPKKNGILRPPPGMKMKNPPWFKG